DALDAAIARLDQAFSTFRAALAAGQVRDATHWRLGSLVTVGRLVARAARRRQESRGGHFRTDFPARDDIHWRVHVAERLQLQPDPAAPLPRR
ncbi:MAG TPA: hypothetical protein VND92_09965, partial [Vicinamibacterales bacterium]|nr:hypothetical protein [Vicinamibacterales bacterium]